MDLLESQSDPRCQPASLLHSTSYHSTRSRPTQATYLFRGPSASVLYRGLAIQLAILITRCSRLLHFDRHGTSSPVNS